MIIVHVHVRVKPESVELFRDASLDNARDSVEEAGVVRFDVIQQEDDPTRFILQEIYRSSEAMGAHKETPHYARWRDTVESMMAEQRRAVRFRAHFPEAPGWEIPR